MAGFNFKDNSNLVMRKFDANARQTIDEIGEVLVESVQNAMLYNYSKEVVDTGALFDSIRAETKRVSQNTYSTDVGSDLHYAGYVHEGTRKMKGRPYIRDGVMDAQDKLEQIAQKGLSQGF